MGTGSDLAEREVLKPEVVDGVPERAAWDEDCPVCHAHHATGPEGAGWGRHYCWRCGYSPDKPVAGGPVVAAQPDWAQLVKDAVREAMFSEPQKLAEAMTASLGRDGMLELMRQQQEALGFTQEQQGGAPPAPPAV